MEFWEEPKNYRKVTIENLELKKEYSYQYLIEVLADMKGFKILLNNSLFVILQKNSRNFLFNYQYYTSMGSLYKLENIY